MKVVLRVDASEKIGTGHFMRCLTLADTLLKRGAQCVFLSRDVPAHLQHLVQRQGHTLRHLPVHAACTCVGDLAHSSWLGTDQVSDAADCLAALLARELPGAQSLVLAFEAGGGPSPGTAKTSVEGLGKGGRARIGGELKRVPLAWKDRVFERDGEERTAMTIPWGDVYTAHISTGIPDIEVYMAVPPATVTRLRKLRRLGPLLGWGIVQAFLKKQVAKKVRGPSEKTRGKTGCVVWGEVRSADQRLARRILRTPNGYDLTVTASLGIVQRLLDGPTVAPGFRTPSLLMGADYVLGLPGVSLD